MGVIIKKKGENINGEKEKEKENEEKKEKENEEKKEKENEEKNPINDIKKNQDEANMVEGDKQDKASNKSRKSQGKEGLTTSVPIGNAENGDGKRALAPPMINSKNVSKEMESKLKDIEGKNKLNFEQIDINKKLNEEEKKNENEKNNNIINEKKEEDKKEEDKKEEEKKEEEKKEDKKVENNENEKKEAVNEIK